MKKEKGFTLVELIAVIILLGIIALIAIPTVNELLKEARMSAFEDTAYGLVRAGTLYYQKQELRDEVTSNITFTFPEATGLEVSGKKPSSGTMVVDIDGNVSLAVSNGRYCARKEFKDSEITLDTDIDNCTITTKTYAIGDPVYFNPVQNQLCSDYTEANSATGVKTGCMRFYIYKEDTSNYGLILDHNTTALTAWINEEDYGCGEIGSDCAENDKGPITLMNQLTEDTTNQGWKVSASVPTIEDIMGLLPWYQNLTDKTNFTEAYFEYAKTSVNTVMSTIQANASNYANTLEMYKAMTNMIKTDYNDIYLPDFLHQDLYGNCDTDGNCTTNGYWTSSPVAGIADCAWYVHFGGFPLYLDVYDAGDYGLRPVISLSKSMLR